MKTKRLPPTVDQVRSDPGTPAVCADSVATQFAALEERFTQLKAQVRQAQQLASLGTAAMMNAHEVNNLLTPVVAYVQTALGTDDAALREKALVVTLKHCNMLIAMSARILEIGAAKPQKIEVVNVKEAVESALASLCRDLARDSIQLSQQVDDSTTVRADALQLQQVLFNLLLNAREAMAKQHGGRLTITATPHSPNVVIQVRSTGKPIPADLLPHVFEPLQSSKPSQRDGLQRCGGLGLALCHDLVEENGGAISVTSDADSGTTFTITLPAADPES